MSNTHHFLCTKKGKKRWHTKIVRLFWIWIISDRIGEEAKRKSWSHHITNSHHGCRVLSYTEYTLEKGFVIYSPWILFSACLLQNEWFQEAFSGIWGETTFTRKAWQRLPELFHFPRFRGSWLFNRLSC